MCRRWTDLEPCMDYGCPHNLFWEGLRLNLAKIHMTDKALAIGNCCCLIDEPWTSDEIGDIWGMTKKRIRQSELIARRKVQKEGPYNQSKKQLVS